MLLIDWGGRLHHNDEALLKLRVMWQSSFDANARILMPVLSEHIGQNSRVWQASSGQNRPLIPRNESLPTPCPVTQRFQPPEVTSFGKTYLENPWYSPSNPLHPYQKW